MVTSDESDGEGSSGGAPSGHRTKRACVLVSSDSAELSLSSDSDEAEVNEADEEQESREREQATGFGSSSPPDSADEDEI